MLLGKRYNKDMEGARYRDPERSAAEDGFAAAVQALGVDFIHDLFVAARQAHAAGDSGATLNFGGVLIAADAEAGVVTFRHGEGELQELPFADAALLIETEE
jgi:hypothetical protein